MELLRTIHYAGCGSFCTETFEIWNNNKNYFNVVYDCGSSDIQQELLINAKKYFNHFGNIDLLFISHLDADHVNGIKELSNFMDDKTKVVLPYFEKEYRLLSFCDCDDCDYFLYYFDLIDFLEKKQIKIIFISADKDDDDKDNDPININELQSTKYPSGKTFILKKFHHNIWNYIPFNIQKNVDINIVIKECKDQKLNDDDINNCVENKPIDENIKKKLKEVYNKISKTYKGVTEANMSSMLLISKEDASCYVVKNEVRNGWHTDSNSNIFNLSYTNNSYCLNNASCLYTGDAGLKDKIFFDIALKYYNKHLAKGVGIMQIPHHGTVKYYPLELHNKIIMEMGFINITIKSENPLLYAYIPFDFALRHTPLYMVTNDQYSKIINNIILSIR